MAITIVPAAAPDIKTLVHLNTAAFPSTYGILFGDPIKPETIDALTEQRVQTLLKEDESLKSQAGGPLTKRFFLFKAVDDETGQIVGESRWMFYYEDEKLTKTIEEEAAEMASLPAPQMNAEATRAWQRGISTMKRSVLAVPQVPQEEGGVKEDDLDKVTTLRKRIYLHVLAVHPDHQRKGIGRKLLQWGLDEADKLGLIAYLEASVDGRHLYETTGFKVVKEARLDFSPFGKEVVVPLTVSFFHWVVNIFTPARGILG